MLPSELSSGDATADRRADYARMLAESGDPVGAAEIMEQALERAPSWPGGWFGLGLYREKAGNRAGAAAAFTQVIGLDVDDLFGAPLMLASLGATAMPDRPSSRYIERMFDDYATRFDEALLGKLDYRVPIELAALVAETAGLPRHFGLAADLGCGTGLFGAEVRSRVDRLEGFDLSQKMLAKAEEKQLYDRLGVADLSLPAARSGLFGDHLAAHRADLIAAADVLIYLGNLDTIFALVAELAAPDAIFAFSIEDAGKNGPYELRPSLRYAHSASYVEALCAKHRMTVCARQSTVMRMDAGKPIAGLLFIARIGH
jgi:predicted TPR repeat methyltransferase